MKTLMKKTVCLLVILLLLAAMPALAAERTVTVSGSATVYLEADTAHLYLGVRIKRDSLTQAQSECAEKIAAVLAALEKAGVGLKDAATSDYSVYSGMDYVSEGVEKQYYQVNHILNITVRDISDLGGLIDVCIRAGANAVDNIAFTAQDLDGAHDQALKNAVEDGRHKAEILSAAAGLRLGALISINNSEGQNYVSNSRSYKAYGMEMAADEAAATVIQSGSVSVSAAVTLVFALEEP